MASRRIPLSIALCVALLVSVLVALGAPAGAAPSADQIIQDEAYWISLAQVPPDRGPASGAIARYRLTADTVEEYVSPYDGTVGARGMLAAGSRYHPMVKAWIEWYFGNLNWPDYSNVYGTIHDFWVNPHTGEQRFVMDPLTGQPRYDSTDAYAGVFLSLLRDYAEQVPEDHDYLRQHAYLMDVVANVVIATKHDNGLTGARPDWQGEYLLDNIDAEQGLADYAWIARNVLDDGPLADYWQDEADSLRRAIEAEIWFEDAGMYGWASDQPNPDWDVFYADSVVQSWPVMFGYGDDARRRDLWDTFNERWPQWTTSADNPGTPEQQPWATLAYAAAVMGEGDQVVAYLEGSQDRWAGRDRPRPWSVNDSAFRALTAQIAGERGWMTHVGV